MLSHSPRIITDGMVLCLDAANPKNYNLTEVEVLVVAGGGGAGHWQSGGGGAGGLIYNRNFAVTPGSALTVTVGGGGANAGGSGGAQGSNGGNSVFGSLTATGGGGGGGINALTGKNGGSGGGGGGGYAGGSGGTGTSGQGFAGGNGTSTSGAGGGGAGSIGSNGGANLGGNGGDGLGFAISGTFTYYAGGGGGGTVSAGTAGTGGLGGGGNGSTSTGSNGTANTGGGGGGGGEGPAGGNGGSGIVIVRYPGPQKAIGGTVTSVAGHTIHTFTTVGSTTFTPLVATNNSAILGLSDFSGNGNFGTTANSPVYSSANGGSIVFDGTNDYISMPFETILNDCSIEIWFKATSTRSYQYLLSIGNEVNSSYSFYLDMNDPDGSGFAQTMWVYWNSGGTPYSVIPKTGTYGDWNDSTWRHYVFTRSSTTNHYMNGSLVTNVSRSGDQTTQFGNGSGYKLKIGVYQITNTNAFPGNIAQVKIYNRALTASEIQQNFQALRGRFGI